MDKYYKVPEEDLLYLVECRYVLGNLISDINWATYYKTVERARSNWQKKFYPSLPEDSFISWTELSRKEMENNYDRI